MSLEEKAVQLFKLHHAAAPVVLVNAWDVASARIIEDAGFPAIATTSAGVANALGYPDGQKIPWAEMLFQIAKMVAAVQAPVTADIESGFSADEHELDRAITLVIKAGAVGVNLEDLVPNGERHATLFSIADQVQRIKTARAAGEKLGIHLVINARTDAFWQAGAEPSAAMANTLERGHAYLSAGADCIFVPGMRDPNKIKAVVEAWKAPVNILAGPGVPSITELGKLGVKRVSFGSGPMRAAMGALRKITREALASGTYAAMAELAIAYDDMNGLFEKN
ncbi:MAG TPA: isocitrate lyase/phosphoenolpyruvate mutase family protein [Candidatus Angelobacter sp.]|nr:isocitrate lyase/phosphoenolpyruvate mutase family protein [Candidatus Angelobacter sp.]